VLKVNGRCGVGCLCARQAKHLRWPWPRVMSKDNTLITLEIPISEERLEKLKAVAKRQKVAPEELIQMTIDELIKRPEQEIIDVMNYVLRKNADLYRRLA
jgi:antitoxin FitA